MLALRDEGGPVLWFAASVPRVNRSSLPSARVGTCGVAPWGTSTKLFQFLHGLGTADCIDFQNLTSSQEATLAAVGDTPTVANRFTFSNNVVARGTYGFFGGGVGEGTAALNQYMTNWAFAGNAIYGSPSVPTYPPGNSFPATQAAVGFVSPDAGNFRGRCTLGPSRRSRGGGAGRRLQVPLELDAFTSSRRRPRLLSSRLFRRAGSFHPASNAPLFTAARRFEGSSHRPSADEIEEK